MASRFWVGGTGTWDASTTTHWSASSGGAGGASVPGAADDVTFDGSSGGGTVTVATNFTTTAGGITMGAFTGTLDYSVNNNNFTGKTFKCSGTGVRTLNMGSGTFTIIDIGGTIFDFGTATSLTLNTGTCTVKFQLSGTSNSQMSIAFPQESVVNAGGGVTWPNVILDGTNGGSNPGLIRFSAGNGPLHIANLTLANHAPSLCLNATGSANPLTITTSFTCPINQATASALVGFGGVNNWTIPNGTVLNFLAIQSCAFTGTTLVANNSFDLGGNSGITINAPAGGAHMIGG